MRTRRRVLVSLAGLGAASSAGCFGEDGGDPDAEGLTAERANNHLHGIAYDPADGRLYLATHYGLYVHRDGDVRRIGDSRTDHMGFAMHPDDPTVLYRSGHRPEGGNLGVERSTDGGETWEQLFAGVDDETVDFHSMSISDADPDVMYGVYRGNLYRSETAGEDWQIAGGEGFPEEGLPWGVPNLAADPADPSTVLAAAADGVYESTDGGESWRRRLETPTSGLLVAPDDPDRLYGFTADGIVESSDRGETWSTLLVADALDGSTVFGFAPDRSDPSTLYAAAPDPLVVRTTDGGENWDRVVDD